MKNQSKKDKWTTFSTNWQDRGNPMLENLPFEYNWSTFFSAAPFWLVLSILFEPPCTLHHPLCFLPAQFWKECEKMSKDSSASARKVSKRSDGWRSWCFWQMDCNECWLTWLPTLLLPIDRSGFLNSTKYLSPNSCCTNHTCPATSSQRQRERHNHRQRQRHRKIYRN